MFMSQKTATTLTWPPRKSQDFQCNVNPRSMFRTCTCTNQWPSVEMLIQPGKCAFSVSAINLCEPVNFHTTFVRRRYCCLRTWVFNQAQSIQLSVGGGGGSLCSSESGLHFDFVWNILCFQVSKLHQFGFLFFDDWGTFVQPFAQIISKF